MLRSQRDKILTIGNQFPMAAHQGFRISWRHGKIERSPVIATFMPVVQPKTDLFRTTDVARFLSQCQQQATDGRQAKIASLSFPIAPVAPWEVLQTLGNPQKRHFYYDPPHQPSMVGLDVVVEASAVGKTRFDQAQFFVEQWRSHFIYARPAYTHRLPGELAMQQPSFQPPFGHFFCSATFFDDTVTASFEPTYVFVPQLQVATRLDASIVTFNVLVTVAADIKQITARLHRQLRALVDCKATGQAPVASHKVTTKDVAGFEPAVKAVLSPVKNGRLHKVVLADVMDVVTPQPIDEVRSLQTLRHNHPDCTVFSVSNGKGQSFIGASPERLLSIRKGQLTTDALAGSASRSPLRGIDHQLAQSLLHSEKERYEHRVVVEFIVHQLRSLGLSPHYASSPQILQLANIQHLHTPISALLSPHSISPLEIIDKLHPTPAVAGLPRQLACQLIRQHETFDRGLYAAPLGWMDTEGNSEFIVGIRSALIDGCKARLYAGAGIVSGSEPAKELAEIKLKLQTLLNALV